MADDDHARRELAAAYRWCHRFGWNEGVANHLSVRTPERHDAYLVIPYGMHWAEVRASDLLVVGLDDALVSGDGRPEPTALTIHGAIYRRRPDVASVLHTHQPNITALTAVEGVRVELFHQGAMHFHDRIAYDQDYGGVATDTEEGERIAAALGDRDIAMLASHGVVTTGESVVLAFDDLYYLDRLCELQRLALQTGAPLRRIDPEIAVHQSEGLEEIRRSEARMHFDALIRMLERDGDDFAS